MVSLQVALAALALSVAGETAFYDFHADWCGPCRAMAPMVDELARLGYPVKKVNIDQNPDLAAKYAVRSIPCFVMVVDGREVDRVVGGTTFSRLERMCKLASTRQPNPQPPPPTAPTSTTDRQLATGTWTPRPATASVADAGLIAASVRLRIEDPNGHSCGSGTIIDARDGEALVLTCGHIFRDSAGKGRIEADLFGVNDKVIRHLARVPGRLISYDLERDVGLIAIRTSGPMVAARVAPPGYQVEQGNPVVSTGCNHGNSPSAEHSRVMSLDRFLGPPNLQVAGQSVEGRSGGGLFSRDGLVIGVCNAADPSDNQALYAALGAIHAELDEVGLSHIYKSPGEAPASQPASPAPRTALVAVDPPVMPKRMPPVADPRSKTESPLRPVSAPLRPAEQAALDEIRQRLHEGAEVICVVRSRRDPMAKSEIIVLDKASPDFLQQLAAEAGSHHSRRLTSLEIPRKCPAASTRR